MKICIVQTGGTIDKDYPKSQLGYAFEIGESAAKIILKEINPDLSINFVTAFRKDSQDITQKDRDDLVALINALSEERIIISHGTDTMLVTAEYLESRIQSKTIIITGAMKPEKFKNSDASFNLGGAIIAVQNFPVGIFICLHGKCHPISQVKRDKYGRFTSK